MPWVILHTGQPLDQQRDPGQRPEPRTEAVGARPLAQRGVKTSQLVWRQPRLAPRAAGGTQRLAPTSAPRTIPSHDALATDAQPPRDRALRLPTRRKQPDSLVPTHFHPAEIPAWGNTSEHASIVRCRRRSSVTILCEIQ
jgi:hypothetical protein